MMIITLCSWCEIVSPLVWTVSPGPWSTVTRWLGWAGLGWAGLGWLGWLADVQCYSAQPSTMWLIVHMNTS